MFGRVPATTPPSTPVPIAFCAPELMASGTTPKPKASEVARIGRSRLRCRGDRVLALLPQRLGELHDEDGVFRRESGGREQTDLEIDVGRQEDGEQAGTGQAQADDEHEIEHEERAADPTRA
jgi:hypothetical protein